MSGRDVFDRDRFEFRGLHPAVYMGTASDRYAGWIGQIYSENRYAGKIGRRTRKLAGKSLEERVLPVESVNEYFEHFRVLEVDYTFYYPLMDEKGQFTRNFHVLRSYGEHMSGCDYVILKVPQTITAQKIKLGKKYVRNDHYLDPELFVRQFYNPAQDLLGGNLRGFIFEQEYQRSKERTSAEEVAKGLDDFFGAVPKDERYHIELRTESYLNEAVFQVLEKHGVGQVLSHWTWLPSLQKQFSKAGRRFFNSGKQNVIRLMTLIGTRYEEAYALAHPFDKLIDSMLQSRMIDETAELMWEGIGNGVQVNVIVNNRAGGNAPLVAQRIADRFRSTGLAVP